MKCIVTLFNQNLDNIGQKVLGNIRFTQNGFHLEYAYEGDSCTLRYNGENLLQKRRGGLDIDTVFSERQKTECILNDNRAGLNFILDVFTESLQYSKTETGISLKIIYKMGGNPTILQLTAEKIQEK